MSRTQASSTRPVTFAPRLEQLLRDHLGEGVFRLDDSTIGIADPDLMDAVLAARPATEHERPTFKPLRGRSIGRPEAADLMQALGRDVRTALGTMDATPVDLAGSWPYRGHQYLRELIFGRDPYRLKAMVDRRLELTPKLTWTVIALTAPLPVRADPGIGSLGRRYASSHGYRSRRHAMGTYRRMAAPVCFTVSTLVGSALWLAGPFEDPVQNKAVLYEAMRLLPPSWNILRLAGPEYARLHPMIRPTDDLLLLPLLSHRDPARWEAPAEFRPERWGALDPDNTPGYLPFGHASERCWGRHLVMPLAERLLDLARDQRLRIDPSQTSAAAPLAGLLGAAGVRMIRG